MSCTKPYLLLCLSFAAVVAAEVRINEVSDAGSSGVCDGKDWIELYTSEEVDLNGYVLHDDRGPDDDGAFTFTATEPTAAGSYILLCTDLDDPVTSPQFGIGGADTVTLRNTTGDIVSTTGQLPGKGDFDISYMYDEGSAAFAYTSTPTPGSENVLTQPFETVEQIRARLDKQNAMGTKFFNMDGSGYPVPDGFDEIVDLRIVMDPALYDQLMEDQSLKQYVQFDNATVTTKGEPDTVLLDLPSPGRIRTKGQSTLAYGTCMANPAIPFSVDWDRTDANQTLFGVQRSYLRTHFLDGSYSREWAAMRMLARFGLPHMRVRSVRLFINGEYIGFYSLFEAPDHDYVFSRSFPDFDPENYALYKVKTSTRFCGFYPEELIELAESRVNETTTPPYQFQRGEHLERMPVLEDIELCETKFGEQFFAKIIDSALAWLRWNRDCGKMLVEEEIVGLDLGTSSPWNEEMAGFLNRNLASFACADPPCSNSNLPSEVDTESFLRNFAVMAILLHHDSPINAEFNNFYLAQTGDGGGWKMVQWDHNSMLSSQSAALGCNSTACIGHLVHWSVVRPTCNSLSSNPIVAPLLGNPNLRNQYVGYIRDFVDTVTGNSSSSSFFEQLSSHLEAIKDDVIDDPWYFGGFEDQLAEDSVWFKPTEPLVPLLRARLEDVRVQLDALEQGTYPDNLPDGIPSEVPCADWRTKAESDQSAPTESGQSAPTESGGTIKDIQMTLFFVGFFTVVCFALSMT